MSGTVLADERPIARTPHQCFLCYRRIEPGETYHRQRVIGDDGPYVWKECAHCSVLAAAVWADLGNWLYDEGLNEDTRARTAPSMPRRCGHASAAAAMATSLTLTGSKSATSWCGARCRRTTPRSETSAGGIARSVPTARRSQCRTEPGGLDDE